MLVAAMRRDRPLVGDARPAQFSHLTRTHVRMTTQYMLLTQKHN